MKDRRIGECLWFEWSGDCYTSKKDEDSLVYMTEGHVDTEIDVVQRALASAIQRDGTASSLFLAFKALESAEVSHCYAGYVDEANEMSICDEGGETVDGEVVDEVLLITVVELCL